MNPDLLQIALQLLIPLLQVILLLQDPLQLVSQINGFFLCMFLLVLQASKSLEHKAQGEFPKGHSLSQTQLLREVICSVAT